MRISSVVANALRGDNISQRSQSYVEHGLRSPVQASYIWQIGRISRHQDQGELLEYKRPIKEKVHGNNAMNNRHVFPPL